MTLPNPNSVVTEQRLHDFYTEILPYLGRVDAGYTPVGSVIIMSGNEAPTNYLACDGTVYNIADYPELAAFYARSQGSCNFYGGNGTTTFAVPDWRGEFIRGAGTNSHANQGNGAAVGVHQDGTEVVQLKTSGSGTIIHPYANNKSEANFDTQISIGATKVASDKIDGDPWDNNSLQLGTTRPTNTSVLFCVATKNIYLNPSLDYSTDEKVVGTWIDGKPLYQRTVKITNLSQISTTRGWYSVYTDSTIDYDVVMVDFSASFVNAIAEGVSYISALNEYITEATSPVIYTSIRPDVDQTTHNLNLRMLNSGNSQLRASGANLYVTIKYTKTTD